MRREQEDIQVTLNGEKKPSRIIRRKVAYHVTGIHDEWRYAGKWRYQEQARQYFRLTVKSTRDGRLIDWKIYKMGSQWILDETYD